MKQNVDHKYLNALQAMEKVRNKINSMGKECEQTTITVTEAAKRVGVSRSAIENRVWEGTLPADRTVIPFRLDIEDVDAYSACRHLRNVWLPWAPLQEALGTHGKEDVSIHMASEMLGVPEHRINRWRKYGIPFWVADEMATRIGLHPASVWVDWYEQG